MFDWLKHALEWLKTPAHYFLPLFVASAFGLFAPIEILEFLGIAFWRNDGKPYIGSIFVISAAIVLCAASVTIVQWFVSKYLYVLGAIRARGCLKCLSTEEKKALARYLESDSRTQLFSMEDGVIRGLVASKILYPALTQGEIDHFPFNMQPWAWAYLNKHPHIVVVSVKHGE